MGFANKMAPGVFEGAEQQSGFKNIPSRQIFPKKGDEALKNSISDYF